MRSKYASDAQLGAMNGRLIAFGERLVGQKICAVVKQPQFLKIVVEGDNRLHPDLKLSNRISWEHPTTSLSYLGRHTGTNDQIVTKLLIRHADVDRGHEHELFLLNRLNVTVAQIIVNWTATPGAEIPQLETTSS